MNAIIDAQRQGIIPTNVQLLSPAFNMTHGAFPALVQQMKDEGGNFDGLAGFAGNIYNTNSGTIEDNWTNQHVNDLFGGRPVFITETGSMENSGSQGISQEDIAFLQSQF